ncbi:MAG: amidohydrolase family protein [Coriobacteriales bacterium]|nr:amidohydrolase family protein [Coriobacteriales bacterium]
MSIIVGQHTTPIIDFHVHVYPDALAARVVKAFSRFPIEIFADATVAGWLAHMDQSGVEKSVLLSVATKPSQVETVNDFLRPFLGHERFIPFAGVHPEHKDPVGVIRQAAEDGFTGIKLHPIMQNFKPQEKRLRPLYDAAIEEGLIIVFHAGAGMDYDAIRGSKEDFDALLAQYDYERFVFAHLGGRPNFQKFPEFKSGWPGYLDLAYSVGFMPDEYLLALIRDFGSNRILFGTDGPWQSEAENIARLKTIGLSEQELADILYNNAARLLNIR